MRNHPALILAVLLCLLVAPVCFGADVNERLDQLEKQVAALNKSVIKIATIDEVDVVDHLEEWRDRKVELLTLERKFTGELDKLIEQMKTLDNSMGVMADGPERDKARTNLMSLEQEYSARRDANRKELLDKRSRYIDQLRVKVTDEAAAYAKAKGFDLIVVSDALVYNNKVKVEEITEQIYQRMNEQYLAETDREPAAEDVETPEEQP